MEEMKYTRMNAGIIDRWCREGWRWGQPIRDEEYQSAREGRWHLLLTPNKSVPKAWLRDLKGKKVLGLAAGGAQQMPVFAALGAECTLLDISPAQCRSDREFAARMGYTIDIHEADMTEPLPFPDESFDLIFLPVSTCYIRYLDPLFIECYRVLKPGGQLLGGFDNGFNYCVDDNEKELVQALPFDPLTDPMLMQRSVQQDYGVQFSHTAGETIAALLRAGFSLRTVYEDTNESGRLKELNIPTYIAVHCRKER